MPNKPSGQDVRIDQWLWAARFFKTRSLASKAVRGGHVRIGDERVKASRIVHAGDRVDIVRGGETVQITVTALSARRGPASVAAGLYEETQGSIEKRAADRETRRLERAAASEPPARRPDKRGRRQIVRMRREPDS